MRLLCPKSRIVLVKILPAFDPTKEADKAVVDINAALDALQVDADPKVTVLDSTPAAVSTSGARGTKSWPGRLRAALDPLSTAEAIGPEGVFGACAATAEDQTGSTCKSE